MRNRSAAACRNFPDTAGRTPLTPATGVTARQAVALRMIREPTPTLSMAAVRGWLLAHGDADTTFLFVRPLTAAIESRVSESPAVLVNASPGIVADTTGSRSKGMDKVGSRGTDS